MHLAEGTLPLSHAAGWGVALAAALVWSARARRAPAATPDQEAAQRALQVTATSVMFAATLLPLPVPVAGATSHLCLTPAMALLFGASRVLVPAVGVLLIQAVFFAHGGLTTLGANALTLGLVGPLVAVGLARALRPLPRAWRVGLAAGLASLSIYAADALILSLGLKAHAPMSQTSVALLLGFAPVQLPLALVEGALTAWMLAAIAKRRPGLMPPWWSLPGPTPQGSPGGALLIVWLVVAAAGLSGCAYEGLDGQVFGAIAARHGRAPQPSALDLSGGELGLLVSVATLFVMGFAAGRGFERLFGAGGPR